MIEQIPYEVRLHCWEYLSIEDYGSLAMTCRTLEQDRRQLDPTRYVCIQHPTTNTSLQRSRVLHNNTPICLRLETSLPSTTDVSLPAVTEMQLATDNPIVLSANTFPNVRNVKLQNNTTTFQDVQQMGKLFQSLQTLIVQNNHHFDLSGHDLRHCEALHTLILQDCVLQVITDSEDSHHRTKKLDVLSWMKAPLRSVTLQNVQYQYDHPTSIEKPIHKLSQDMIMNFVRRRPQLHYFQCDALTNENKKKLRTEFPHIQIE